MAMNESGSRRYLALFFPFLSADRWLLEQSAPPGSKEGAPLAFVEMHIGDTRIISVDEIATTLGVAPGQLLSEARMFVPDLIILHEDRAANEKMLKNLAKECEYYSPAVTLDPPDGLIFDISNCLDAWDGENELISDLVGSLAWRGMSLRLALAHTPAIARTLARNGGELLRAGRRLARNKLNEARMPYQPPLATACPYSNTQARSPVLMV
jgi:protein ImuB